MARKAGLVFVSLCGVGHFIHMLDFAKRLLQTTESRFSITVLVVNPPPPGSSTESYVQSVASSGLDIHFEEIRLAAPPTIRGPEDITACFVQSHESIKAAITRCLISSTSIAAVVLDLFATNVLDITSELNIPSYIYFFSTALLLALMLHLPTLHEKISVEFGDMEGEVQVPGIFPISPLCMPTPLMNKKGLGYSCMVELGRRILEAKGIIINSFLELELGPLKGIQAGFCVPNQAIPPIYPVGPLALQNDSKRTSTEQNKCMEWLNGRPASSVVFLSLAGMRGLSAQVLQQMAIGLERSGVRFLWCLPKTMAEHLPEGFLERTKDKGMVWHGSFTQEDILAHTAVGGFVTQCGWNAIMESLWLGVPMIGWPLFADQHLNAFQMAKEVGVSVELKMDRKGGNFVEAEEFERGLRCLMEDSGEGRKVIAKVAEMQQEGRKAVQKGGSSFETLELLAEELSSSISA